MAPRIGMLIGNFAKTAPHIDYERSTIDWDIVRLGSLAELSQQRLVVSHREALTWDYYPSAGIPGFASARFRDAVSPAAEQCFSFWPISLNGAEYYVIRQMGTIDCLNEPHCEVMRLPDGTVYAISKFSFHLERIPDLSMFAVKECIADIFATAALVRKMLKLRLRGIYFQNAEMDVTNPSSKWREPKSRE